MAQYDMAAYLSTVTPDYAYTLNITPQKDMFRRSVKNQIQKFTDDNMPLILNIDDNDKFIVRLIYEVLSTDNAKIIMDLWSKDTYANGLERSFRWYNPADTKIYVAYFNDKNGPRLKDFREEYQGFDSIELLVVGNYVP